VAAGIWRLADPKISLASIAGLLLGACLAAREGPLHPGWLAVTLLGIFAVEVAKNASGEIFDFDSGVDLAVSTEELTPFSGGKRVLVEGLLSRDQTARIAAVGYSVGAICGLSIVLWREPAVLALGVAGLATAFFYHAPPLSLSYRGLGEVAVALCYGPLIVSGTYLVQRGRLTSEVLLASAPLGLLIAAFLWINEFPDSRADEAAGKRTLVVRLGRRRARVVFAGIGAAAFFLLGLLPSAGLARGVWLGGLAMIPFASAARGLAVNAEEGLRLIPAQRNTLLAFLLLAAGSGLGLLLTP
jgi:1,4-dihydroxy-2-naphthoate octaprenyltransferase